MSEVAQPGVIPVKQGFWGEGDTCCRVRTSPALAPGMRPRRRVPGTSPVVICHKSLSGPGRVARGYDVDDSFMQVGLRGWDIDALSKRRLPTYIPGGVLPVRGNDPAGAPRLAPAAWRGHSEGAALDARSSRRP